ncbi:minichromosome maintenance protein 5 [Blyttiomyces sp. JEL0837]|nr:minichromosome maintenance protein 5 [Blyttiomyces sp. JEL0837]
MSGWDNGQRFSAPALDGEQSSQPDNGAAISQKFENFLNDFRVDNVYIYRDQLRQNIMINQYFIELDLAHLTVYHEELANLLRDKPGEMLPLFEKAVQNVAVQNRLIDASVAKEDRFEFQLMILSNANPIPIRELDATYISKLVRISGITIQAATLSARATQLHIMCKTCRNFKSLTVPGGFAAIQLPRKCDSSTGGQTPNECPLDPYTIVHDKSKFVDMQKLKLQESPDIVPVGELPRHMLLHSDRYLTNKVIPGIKIAVTGIYSIFQQKTAKNQGATAIRSPYLRVIGMQADVDGGRNRTFTPAEEEEFIALSRRPNLYEDFARSIAPSIYGSNDIKKAIACLLFGGSKKVLPDGMKLRGDVNVLLLGDPGTAKSQLLKFVEKVAPTAVYTSGKGSSAAGLTASVVRDSGSREFHLEAGAMVLADGGVVCIDEFDKMREEDRVAIHEAMEQQTISIAKAGITTILNSRTSVLAAANPVFGRYDDMKSASDNIDFQSTILSRFDLIFIVKDEHNETRDQTIAKHVLNIHMNHQTFENAGEIPIQKMRGYISYCKAKCAPRLSSEAAQMLSSHFVEVRSRVRGMETKATIPITIRQLEAIIRISESIAKISLSPTTNQRHVTEAIRLFNISTMNAIQMGQGSSVIMTNSFKLRINWHVEFQQGLDVGALSADVNKIQSHIRRRLPVGSRISSRNLKDELINQNFTDATIDKAIGILLQKEVLQYEKRRLILRRIAL